MEGTIEGSRVNYSCTSRMVLRGDAVRECLPNGQWSGTLPTCDRKNYTTSTVCNTVQIKINKR